MNNNQDFNSFNQPTSNQPLTQPVNNNVQTVQPQPIKIGKQQKKSKAIIIIPIILLLTLLGFLAWQFFFKNINNTSSKNNDSDNYVYLVKYNNIEYKLKDIGKVLFDDGWHIKQVDYLSCWLINDNYAYHIILNYSIDSAIGDLNSKYDNRFHEFRKIFDNPDSMEAKEAANIFKNTKVDGIELWPERKEKDIKPMNNISISNVTLDTPIENIVSLLPPIDENIMSFDNYNSVGAFERKNDNYEFEVSLSTHDINFIELSYNN